MVVVVVVVVVVVIAIAIVVYYTNDWHTSIYATLSVLSYPYRIALFLLFDCLLVLFLGTPQWMAPEVIKGTQMTTGWMKADVWSLGCTGTVQYSLV